ncbi:MAG: hypothetical protein WBW88_13690 [Rhodothermales bacterium]
MGGNRRVQDRLIGDLAVGLDGESGYSYPPHCQLSSRDMRHVLFTVLLFSFAVGQFGTTALVLVRHQHGRRRVEVLRSHHREFDEAEDLTHLVINSPGGGPSNPSFVRIGGDEVLFDGRLYDIVSEEVRGDTLHLWGFRDLHEEEATGRLAQNFEEASRDHGVAAASSPMSDLHVLYYTVMLAALRPRTPDDLRFAASGEHALASLFDEVPHPPPRG